MSRVKRTFVAVVAVAALLAMRQPGLADGVLIQSRDDEWAIHIQASGDQNGNWTGEGILAYHHSWGQWRPLFRLDFQEGGEFDGIVVLSGSAVATNDPDVVFSTALLANPATGEWEFLLGDFFILDETGDVRLIP